MAEKTEINETAKKQLEIDQKARERSTAEYNYRMRGKPTPTQEENDLAMLGVHIIEHEDDGSGPDTFRGPGGAPPPEVDPEARRRSLEAERSSSRPATYQTKSKE